MENRGSVNEEVQVQVAVVTLSPSSPLPLGKVPPLYLHYLDKRVGLLDIYRVCGPCLEREGSGSVSVCHRTATKSANLSFSDHILGIYYPHPHDPHPSRSSVLGDDSVLLKYLHPHLASVVTSGWGGVALSLVDTISGRIVHRFLVQEGGGMCPVR